MLLSYTSEDILKEILNDKKDFSLLTIDISLIQYYFKNEENKESILETGFNPDLYQKIIEGKQDLLDLMNIPYQKLFLSKKESEENMLPLGVGSFIYLSKSNYPYQAEAQSINLLFLLKNGTFLDKKLAKFCKKRLDLGEYIKSQESLYGESYIYKKRSFLIDGKSLDRDFVNNQILKNKNADLIINDLNDFNFLNNNDEKIDVIKRILKSSIFCRKNILIDLMESDSQLFKDFVNSNSLLAYKLFNLFSKNIDFKENRIKMKEFFNVLDEEYQNKIIEEYPYLNKNKVSFSSLSKELIEDNTLDCILNLDVILKSTIVPKAIKDDIEANVKLIIEGTAQGYGYKLTTYIKNSKKCAISLKKEDRSAEDLTRDIFLQWFLKSLELLYENNEKLEKDNLVEIVESLVLKERMSSEINVVDKLQSRNKLRKF